MADRSTARPYAVAAFRQAQEEGALKQWSEMLQLLRAVVTNPAMEEIIANPRLERAKLVKLISDIGGKAFSETGQNFLKVLIYNRRLTLVPEIAELFEEQRRDEEGKTRVEIVSAFKLSPTYADTIAQAMKRRLEREVDLTVRIDKSIIGGVIIRAGDLVIDASLRGRLQQLAQALS